MLFRSNEESNRLTKEGTNKDTPDTLSLYIPEEFDLQGAKLATLTQAIAYRGICNRQKPTIRAVTNRNIDIARESIKAYSGSKETDETIWQGIRRRSIRL